MYDEEIFDVLDQYRLDEITSTHALKILKEIFIRKLEPYIGDDYDNARKILAR